MRTSELPDQIKDVLSRCQPAKPKTIRSRLLAWHYVNPAPVTVGKWLGQMTLRGELKRLSTGAYVLAGWKPTPPDYKPWLINRIVSRDYGATSIVELRRAWRREHGDWPSEFGFEQALRDLVEEGVIDRVADRRGQYFMVDPDYLRALRSQPEPVDIFS